MRPLLVLAGVTLLATTSGCTARDAGPDPTLRMVEPSRVVTDEPATSYQEPAPTCRTLGATSVPGTGSGFVVELNVLSGRPNPAWRLSPAEGRELQRLLRMSPRGIQVEIPDELGGFGVRAGHDVAGVLRRQGLPSRFWVQGDNEVADFLRSTVTCGAEVS